MGAFKYNEPETVRVPKLNGVVVRVESLEALSSTYQPLDAQLTSVATLNWTGNAGKVIKVNAGANGFELAADLTGGGGSTPTGTGFTHITAGVQDAASKLVDTADINDAQITLPKMANVATGTIFYRKSAAAGAPEVQLLATLKTDLGLTGTNSGDQTTIVGITGTLAEFNAALTGADFATGGGTATGNNSGDQTTIVGITGTKAQFDAAVTDGNILYVGDVSQYTDEMAQDAVGLMVDGTLTYVDATPLLQRAALTGAITAPAGSNATSLGSFTSAQLNAAISDGDFQPLDTQLTDLAGLSYATNANKVVRVNGTETGFELAAAGGTGTVTSVTVTQPAAGITVTNTGVAQTPVATSTIALANDLAALEALAGTNTIYYRSAIDTWTAVTIGGGLTFSAGTLDRVTQTTVSGNAGTATALATPRNISITGKVTAAGGNFDGTAALALNVTAVTLVAADIPNIAQSQVTNLVTDLSNKQPLDTQLTDLADLVYTGNGGKAIQVNAGATAFELVTPSGGGVPTTRLINTTAPLSGGGDLSADRTLSITAATTAAAGSMSAADKLKLDGFLSPIHMASDRPAIGPAITDYFASPLSLDASSTYDIECHAHFLKTTAGTVLWTWTFTNAPIMTTSRNEGTPITGYTGAAVTGAPVAAQATSRGTATNAHAASGSLTTAVDHSFVFWVRIRTNLATTIQLRATESAGTITPRMGSYMNARKIA